jgi:TonB family protein
MAVSSRLPQSHKPGASLFLVGTLLALCACASTSTVPADADNSEISTSTPSIPELADARSLAPGDIVTPPQVVDRPFPKYPPSALKQQITGTVLLKVLVDETGRVSDIKVVRSSHPLLADAAVEATRRWRYKPATLNGQPVAGWIEATHDFTLSRAIP